MSDDEAEARIRNLKVKAEECRLFSRLAVSDEAKRAYLKQAIAYDELAASEKALEPSDEPV